MAASVRQSAPGKLFSSQFSRAITWHFGSSVANREHRVQGRLRCSPWFDGAVMTVEGINQ